LGRRKVRDIYGNWVYADEDEDENEMGEPTSSHGSNADNPKLEWRDWVALAVASLETVLLPLIIFIVVLLVIVVFLFHV
jgi:hypothetical protein